MTDRPSPVKVTLTLKAIAGALEGLMKAFEAHVEAVRELAGQAPEADVEPEGDHCLDNPTLTAAIGMPVHCPHCPEAVPPTHWIKHIQRHHPDAVAQRPADGYCPHCGRGDAGPTADQYEQLRQQAAQAEAKLDRIRKACDAMAFKADDLARQAATTNSGALLHLATGYGEAARHIAAAAIRPLDQPAEYVDPNPTIPSIDLASSKETPDA